VPTLRPFAGLLYDPTVAGPVQAVTAPPYDVITPLDRERYHRASPNNVVRLILGRGEPGDDETNNPYTRAADHLRHWRDRGVLTQVAPSVFPYEFEFHYGGRRRRVRGVIAEVELEHWGGSIIPHERTLPGPIEDRLALLRTVRANLSPVYLILPGPSLELAGFLRDAMAARPACEVIDEAGTRHRLWVAPGGSDRLARVVADQAALIADGHHRYTVALAYRDEMRARFGPGPWDAMMMLVVDGGTEDVPVLPIHRVLATGSVADPDGSERVRDLAEVLASLSDDDLVFGTVRIEEGEPVHRVATLDGQPPTVCALHERMLRDVSPAHVRFIPDAVLAEEAVLSGRASHAYILPPTRVDRVWEVVKDRGRLPEKSTYFWPKPRTGMVLRLVGD
jgi:uncharacterized protein (DUF1015 family)